MGALTIRLPNPVHESIKLRREAAWGKREDFAQFLKLVPDVPPLAGDALSSNADTLANTKP
ncbi:MAG: hypothetical protein A3F78_06580 [Burkholderiales bacterium RIFCSPLOWO2_12_FULL_61_40]|nr:MAG: hypothetical protein A3F78_06580 [Burkholderiales bacterium RIFCSPLOWO2_12_FULL_61_40]